MSDTRHLLDPELHAFVDAFPGLELTPEMLPMVRAQQDSMVQLGDPAAVGVSREEVAIEHGDVSVPALLYRPGKAQGRGPAYLHIHGGGYVLGSAAASDAANLDICARLGLTVLSVNYRLAPEHPIPAPLEDCYAGLRWLHEQAQTLAIDPARIAVGGESAGGGLAAATAILARDRGEYAICHQQLTYPMLDCRTGQPGYEGDPLVGEFIWTRSLNRMGWSAFLGDAPAAAPQVPALLEDYAGLPPAWIHTVTLDLFRDENIAYAKALMQAGVATELVVLPGGCHGYQMSPNARLSHSYRASHLQALAHGVGASLT
jgi:acetyl esterase/lipase